MLWLKPIQIYFLSVLLFRSQKWVSQGEKSRCLPHFALLNKTLIFALLLHFPSKDGKMFSKAEKLNCGLQPIT